MSIHKLSSLISIMAEYDKNYHYFTYNGKIITEPITITDDNNLNKIYFINKSIHQFIKDILNNNSYFSIIGYKKNCISVNTPRLVNTKCIETVIYTYNNIDLTIINNSTTPNFKVTKFAAISNKNILIIIENNNSNKIDNDKNKLSQLKLIADILSSSSTIKINNAEIVAKYSKIIE